LGHGENQKNKKFGLRQINLSTAAALSAGFRFPNLFVFSLSRV